MATEVTSINELNEDEVKEQQEILTTFLQEKYPDAVVQYGVMHDLVNYLNAIFSAKERKELNNWKSARSLLAIEENPDIADEDSVDNILSNFNVTRREGTSAYGDIQLELSEDNYAIIPADTVFTCNGLEFTTLESLTVYPSGSESAIADRILKPLDSGNFGCIIPVVASEIGSAGCLKKGTVLANTTINNLVVASAYNDFYGGTDTETNDSLLSRFRAGIATPCWGNRDNIKAILFNSGKLPALVDASIVGMGDTEMIRDQISLFPISTGGKVDIYIKTSPYTITSTVDLTAVAYSKTGGYVNWSINVPANTLFGAWRVTSIRAVDASLEADSYEIIEQTVSDTAGELKPQDVAYTQNQIITVKFRTIESFPDISVGDTKEFTVSLIGLPHIEVATKLCNDRSLKPVSSDVLVKAAVPCIVHAEIFIKYNKVSVLLDSTVDAIKKAVAAKINNKPFTSYLTTAELVSDIEPLLADNQKIASIQLTGIILGPTGDVYRIISSKQLELPDLPLNYVSPKTTAFFSDIDYIDVTTKAIDE